MVYHNDAPLRKRAKIIKERGVPLGRQVVYVRAWRGPLGTHSISSQHVYVPLHGLYVHVHECAYVYACMHMRASVRTHMGVPWDHRHTAEHRNVYSGDIKDSGSFYLP